MNVTDTLLFNPALFLTATALLGLVVGSFLNVVIHRLPIMMEREWRAGLADLSDDGSEGSDGGTTADATVSPERFNLAVPRSRCPSCDSPIGVRQNIPILSWVLLRGRCAGCRSPISARYPLVEATTMLLSLIVAWRFGPTPAAAVGIVVTWFLVAMSMIDLDHMLLPDSLTLPLMWIGLLVSLVPVFADVRSAVIGAAAGYGILWSIYQLFRLVTGKEGMGYGDFKLLAAIGALLGWQALPLVILLSSLVGAVVGVTLILATDRGRDVPIPFGPYLAAAGWIAMVWGDALQSWYGGLLG